MPGIQPVGFEHWPYRTRIAHRGAGRLAPENTLAAMRVGASHGYRMFEFDARLSGDGTVVLMHDDTLDRTTDGSGPMADQRFCDLVRLDAGGWHSAAFAGETVPTLQAVLRWLLANAFQADIEIKPCPGREDVTGAAVAREAVQLWGERLPPPLLTSFSSVALAAARRTAPALPRALLLGKLEPDWLARCQALGCVGLVVRHDAIDPWVIGQAHAARLRILAYTVNDPERVRELEAWGLDGLVTDAVDRIAPDRP